jgi:AbiTii
MGTKMESIVLELQREAMSSEFNISDMLRKSLVVARKLKIKEFEDWVNQELNGFKCSIKDVPDYREIIGNLQYLNVYHGWYPAVIQDEKTAEMVSKNKIFQPITEIEDLVKSDSEYLVIQLPQGKQNVLAELFNEATQFRLNFGKSQAQRILDSVRNIILEWSLKLEEDGIMGEGLGFSKEEKQEARKHDYTVNNFYGPASGVQIQQNTQHSNQNMISEMDFDKIANFVSTLRDNLDKIELQEYNRKTVESEIATIKSELDSPKPKSSVIKQSLQTVRNLIEGVTGNLLASGLLHMIDQINT